MNEHPSTVEEIYQDYSARYAGILVALTEGAHPRTHMITLANMLCSLTTQARQHTTLGVD